ncbi:DUF4153 domain-containing protein [Psychromarinibacter sp. C21-152]|uniref:DUF4153 domain-containing protein n=1 Tax=Psychromarinibacter sediminicola TaxID=3033385 RepID=A0AAE3TAD3_9RHOB|nr:DUF4153 domain-containing protein [Psychromarinibacter sediminicola]MDF0602738.1 DUF4153 domain-containing protein [Psychromarinibacter sediminicola]
MTMAADPAMRILARRALMTGIGGLGGLAAWLLIDVLPNHLDSDRLILFLSAALGGVFACFLAAAGALPPRRAALVAALASLPAAGLLWWGSFRYDSVGDYLRTGHAPIAFGLILFLSLPFLIVAHRPGEVWRSYPALFRQSWDIAVRYAAAWIFVGAFWAVVFLSDALLGLVGLDVIERVVELDPVAPALTGAVLGLALAVVAELADYISPFLILRLLRLFLPVVLVVTAVFLVALPVRGLTELFGGLSVAAVLLSMALGIATLITSAVEREDAEAADSAVLRGAAQALALAVPLLTATALYAVWLRVGDYGWTPDRIAAACASAVGLGYGVLYSLAVLARRGWMERIRRANIAMALAVIAVAALWLTPVLNAERLSARDQVARFTSGAVDAEALDLWLLGHELGRAGKAAVAELAALEHPEAAELDRRIARLETATDRFRFERGGRAEDPAAQRAEILALAAVRPEGHALPPALLAEASLAQLTGWLGGCRRTTPGGHPGCAVLFADLSPAVAGEEALIFWLTGESGVNVALLPGDVPLSLRFLQGRAVNLEPRAIDRVLAGDFALAPVELRALRLDGAEILLMP